MEKKKKSSTFSLALWSLNLTLGLGNLGDSEHLGLSNELLHPLDCLSFCGASGAQSWVSVPTSAQCPLFCLFFFLRKKRACCVDVIQ